MQIEAVATDDLSLKCFNSGEYHLVSQIAPYIDLFFFLRLGAMFILKSSLGKKQLYQLADLIFTPFR